MTFSSSPAFLPTTTSMNKDSERKKKSIFLSFEERECSVCHGVAVGDDDCCSNSSFDTRSITTHSCDTILLQQQEDEDEDDNIVTNMSQSCRSILRDPSHTSTDSSIRTSTSKGSQRVSFAENIVTVHSVQNLKLSLTRKERKRIWDTPRDSFFDITDIFYEDDEDYDESMSMESRLGDVFGAIGSRSKKGQKEKKQSQERNKKKRQQQQQHQQQQQQQQSNSKKSMLRSLASRFSIRKKRRLTKIAMLEWTENARGFSET